MKRRLLAALVGFTLTVALGGGGTAVAAEGPASKEVRTDDGVLVLPGSIVKGVIHRPAAIFIIHRAGLRYDSLELRQSFLPGVEASVHRAPF